MMDERKDNLPEEELDNTADEKTEKADSSDELFQYEGYTNAPTPTKAVLRKSLFKKLLPVLILLSAALLVFVAVTILQKVAPKQVGDMEENVTTYTLVKLNESEVKRVSVVNTSDNYIMYKKAGSVYKIEGKEDKPVDSDIILSTIQYLSSVTSTKKIMVEKDKLGEYGLKSPKATITLETAKDKVVLCVGNLRDSTDGDYYFYLKGDEASTDAQTAVYLLDATRAQACLADHYYYYETDISHYDASSDAENISPVTIDGEKGTKVNIYMADAETGLAYMMDEPINMPFSSDAMNEIFELMTALNSAVAKDDDVSETNLQKLGLAVPQYILTFENNTKEQVIYFGHTDESGMTYCMPKDGNAVYQIPADYVTCLSKDVADMCDVITYTRDVDTVNHIVIKSKNKTYDMEMEGTGDRRVVHVNDRQVESSIFSEFYAYLLGIEVRRVGEKPQGEPYLTMELTLTEDGSKEVLSYYAVDERYCYYEFNGKGMFYVSRQAVDTLLENAQKVYDNKEIATAW